MPEDPTLREFEQASRQGAEAGGRVLGRACRRGRRGVQSRALAWDGRAHASPATATACSFPPQARAVQDLLERPQPLSPASGAAAAATSPHRVSLASGPGEASGGGPGGAGGGGAPATAPPTPSIVSGGQASPRGGSGSASEMPSTPTAARAGVGPAELVLDPNKGPPIWRVGGWAGRECREGVERLWRGACGVVHAAVPAAA